MPRQRRKRPRPEASATRKADDTTAAKAAATSKQATARFGTRHTHSGSLEAAARKALTQDNVGAGPGGGDSDSGSDTGNAGKASHRRRRHAAAAAGGGSDSDSDSGGGSADDEGTGQSGMATAMAKLLGTRLADATVHELLSSSFWCRSCAAYAKCSRVCLVLMSRPLCSLSATQSQ